ncbi:MAG TPA: tRNA pseudouridine(38-40) synthase TruA [Stellaceae bacterium]|nr:tRNA pseudouridine(38-40) synthase TruA [Stellaceae bacterium]
MPRYKLTIEYDGSGLVGWQRQPNGDSVQAFIEEAIPRFAGEAPRIWCAGRTDAGVHATGQVAHVDLVRAFPPHEVRNAINYHIRPAPIAVLSAEIVPDDFDARRSATGRRYLYRILNRRAPPALERGRIWHVGQILDAAAMAEAARRLVGHHDFTSFRASLCQALSPMKTLDTLTVERHGEELHITAAARSFLHHQVRNMVGTLKLVGNGQWSPDDVAAALAARDRARGGPTAPPDGLYLTAVIYGDTAGPSSTGHT